MSDLTNLMKAVVAAPKDDLPRLVLADWLDENGQPERAEFIRVQVEFDKWACAKEWMWAKGMNYAALKSRERELWAALEPWDFARTFARPDWTLTTFVEGTAFRVGPSEGHPGDLRCEVRRGFVAEVRCTLADWCGGECGQCGAGGSLPEHCGRCGGTGRTPGIGPAVVAAHPVERVVLTDRAPLLAPGLGRRAWLADDAMMGQVPDNCRVGLLFRWLPKTPGYAANLRVYESAELALDALSAAALKWAKAEAAG